MLASVGPLVALEFNEGFVRGLPPTQTTTAAFFTVTNPSDEVWSLTRVHSPAAGSVEIHEHINRGGTMQMRQLMALDIPAGESVVFAPGGLHLMLIGLTKPLREGDEVSLQFESEKGAVVEIVFPVISVVNEHRHHHHAHH
nr:copper chaperone PCu(A)C [Litorivivens lipolytica]